MINNINHTKPEILSPAGNFDKLKSALLFGADAVYFAGKSFGMRAAADNFTLEEIEQAAKYTHERGKKLYLTVNIVPRSADIAELSDYLAEIKNLHDRPDAVICADIGVVSLVRKIMPDIDIHISTQANTQNHLSCIAWAEFGVKRVILSRELSFDDIKSIQDNLAKYNKNSTKIELECFVHGAMCVAYSGRCLLSNYYVGRDANKGACTQPCRWKYYLVEEKRLNSYLEVVENNQDIIDTEFDINYETGQKQGTLIFSSKDLCMIEHIDDLVKSGINSFKIEGRMKSAYYTASITNAYRIALDNYYKTGTAGEIDKTLTAKLKEEVESVSHREYDTGYYYTQPDTAAKIVTNPEYIREKSYLGTCVSYDASTKTAIFEQKNKIILNQKAQILSPSQFGKDITVDNLTDENNNPIESAPHPYMIFKIKLEIEVKPGDIIRSM